MKFHQKLFLLLLVFLPMQLGFHFWPEWSYVLGRRIDYLSPTLYLSDILIFLVLAAWTLTNASTIKKYASTILIKNHKIKIFFFAIFTFINIFVSQNKPLTIYEWSKVLEFGMLAIYIIKTKPALKYVVCALSVGVFYSSLLAIAQFIFQHSLNGPLWWLGERTFDVNTPGIAKIDLCDIQGFSCRLLLRPYATFPHPNVLGGFLAVTLPFVILQLANHSITKLSKTKKYFYIATLLLGLTALVLSFSRSAILIGALGILWVSWQHTTSGFAKKIITLSVVILLGLALLFSRNLTRESESIMVREALNNSALTMISHSPLIGVGLGNFLVKLPEVLPSRSVYFLQPVHNIYLLVLAETGIIGFAICLWLLWRPLWTAISKKRYVISNKNQIKISGFSLLALLLLGLVDHYPLDLEQGQLLFTLLLSLSWMSSSS